MPNFYKPLSINGLLLIIVLAFSGNARAERCLEDFLEGQFSSQMKEHNIAGLTLAIYSGDTLQATYSRGFSHVESGRKVDENTGFMIGSVSKLFVWVSVMQLVEQGKLDIRRPVNEYLSGFRLPEHYAPVNMKHLMTHTPGFEDRLHLFSKSYELLPNLPTYLEENLPAQIFEPGTTPAYSNYGVALAAYVIEEITGMEFNDYVDQHIFEPLEMHNTTFRQPASYNITQAKSAGYYFRDGRFTSPYQEFVIPAPAGSAVSTATDMTRFMKALLLCDETPEDEELHPNRILKNETISQMLSLLHTPHPQASGMAYGFMRMDYHGTEILWHGGDTFMFHTAFMLIPEWKTGLFLSINTGENEFDYRQQCLHILDYLNPKTTSHQNNNSRINGLNSYTGSYKSSRRIVSDYLKIFTSMRTVKVSNGPEGLILSMGSDQELYHPQGNDIFVSDYKKIIFTRDERGKIDRLILSHIPIMVFEKVSFREHATFNLLLLITVILIILKNFLTPIVRLFKGDNRSREAYRWYLLLSGVFIVIFLIAFLSVFADIENVVFERPQGLRLILILPWISLLFFISAVFFWIRRSNWSRQPLPTTFWQFIGFLIMLLFYSQMYFWNFFKFWV